MSDTPNWYGPNTNSLKERLEAAHKRNVENVQAPAPAADVVHEDGSARAIAYRSGIKEIEGLVLRIQSLEAQVLQLQHDILELKYQQPAIRGTL